MVPSDAVLVPSKLKIFDGFAYPIKHPIFCVLLSPVSLFFAVTSTFNLCLCPELRDTTILISESLSYSSTFMQIISYAPLVLSAVLTESLT